MSENPRGPGHPADIPSSRVSGRISDATGASSQGVPATPPPPTPVSSGNRLNTKNIIIGAIVTIVTSTTVFYLTQYLNKKTEGNDFLTTKEATTAAWKSYMTYENLYTKNSVSITKNPGSVSLDSVYKDIRKESEKFQKDVTDLASAKNIDKDLIKVLGRRLDNEKNSLPVLEKYYKKLDSINKTTHSLKMKRDALVNEMSRYSGYFKGSFERTINDIQLIAETLSKRYGESFSMNEFLLTQLAPQMIKTNDSVITVLKNLDIDSNDQIIQKSNIVAVNEKNIIGSWDADGQVFTFDKNGKMAWILGNGEKSTGTWKLMDNQLRLDATLERIKKKGYWLFNVSNVTENSLTLISTKDNSVVYFLIRIAHG